MPTMGLPDLLLALDARSGAYRPVTLAIQASPAAARRATRWPATWSRAHGQVLP